MRKRKKPTDEMSGLTIAEEAIHLLCHTPLHIWAYYHIGTIPFIMGLLFFWSDMSRSAFAAERCLKASLGLAFLFIWMKCWQAVFADALRLQIIEAKHEPWSLRKIFRMVVIQTAIQPYGLLILPVALLVTLPFCHVYTFYQYITINSIRSDTDMKTLCRNARKHALLWNRQNILINWLFNPWLFGLGLVIVFTATRVVVSISPILYGDVSLWWFLLAMIVTFHFLLPLSPIGCVAAANIASVLFLLPAFLHSFLGIQTVFTLSSWSSIFNTTFLMTVFGLTFLCIDPLAKAAYALRCFYADSRHNGVDLILRMKTASKTMALLLLGLFCLSGSWTSVQAEESTGLQAPEHQLNTAIDNVMTQPEYAWRMPREMQSDDSTEHGFLWSFLKQVGEHMEKLLKKIVSLLNKLAKWIEKLFPKKMAPSVNKINWQDPVRILLFAFLSLAASILAVFLYRLWKTKSNRNMVTARTIESAPDLMDEKVTADLLPADEWMQMAQELIAKGELRLAARAMFLGCLANLAYSKLVDIAASKSNYEYLRELERHAHDQPRMLSSFSGIVMMFEKVWYGRHEMTEDRMDAYSDGIEGVIHGS